MNWLMNFKNYARTTKGISQDKFLKVIIDNFIPFLSENVGNTNYQMPAEII